MAGESDRENARFHGQVETTLTNFKEDLTEIKDLMRTSAETTGTHQSAVTNAVTRVETTLTNHITHDDERFAVVDKRFAGQKLDIAAVQATSGVTKNQLAYYGGVAAAVVFAAGIAIKFL